MDKVKLNFLVDIGNSRMKFAIANGDNIGDLFFFQYLKNIEFEVFLKRLDEKIKEEKVDLLTIDNIIICSVNKKIETFFLMFLKQFKANFKINLLGKKNKLNFLIENTQTKNELGMDIIANLIAAKTLSKNNSSIVVSFGTATTLNVIKNEKFLGCVILPGINLMYSSLIVNTDQIDSFSIIQKPKLLGLTTNESLNSGIILGQVLFIEKYISLIAKEINDKFDVYLTGGLSEIVKDLFEIKIIYEPKLLFIGLLILHNLGNNGN